MTNKKVLNSDKEFDRIGGVVIDNRTITLRSPSYNKRYYPSYELAINNFKFELKLLKIELKKNRLYIVNIEFGNFGNSSDSDNQCKSFLDALKELGADDRNFICTPPILRKVEKKENEYTRFTIIQCPEKNKDGKIYGKNDIDYLFTYDFFPKYKPKNKLKIKIKNN